MGDVATTETQRVSIKIGWQHLSMVEAWCLKNVGSRLYWLHSNRGGEGWNIKNIDGQYYLELQEPKLMTMAVLSLSEYLEC